MAISVVALAASAPLGAQASARPAARDTVDRYVAAEMERAHIPGVALAVLRGGTPVKIAAYGFADLEHRVPVTPSTVFKIGSVSKQFIATGIVLLQQEGRLGFDDPISKHFVGTPETWSGVTLRSRRGHGAFPSAASNTWSVGCCNVRCTWMYTPRRCRSGPGSFSDSAVNF